MMRVLCNCSNSGWLCGECSTESTRCECRLEGTPPQENMPVTGSILLKCMKRSLLWRGRSSPKIRWPRPGKVACAPWPTKPQWGVPSGAMQPTWRVPLPQGMRRREIGRVWCLPLVRGSASVGVGWASFMVLLRWWQEGRTVSNRPDRTCPTTRWTAPSAGPELWSRSLPPDRGVWPWDEALRVAGEGIAGPPAAVK